MSIFSQYGTDKKLSSGGIWISKGSNSDGTEIKFKISSLGPSNQQYTKIADAETKPYVNEIRLGTIDPARAEELDRKVFCRSVLLDWENVKTEDGRDIAFTLKNAMVLLEILPELYTELRREATNRENFKTEGMATELGNLLIA